MAKQFVELAEAARMLGVGEDQIKNMVREGTLREYRDGGKVQYRTDDVNKLAAREGSSIIDLAVGAGEGAADIGLSGSDVIQLEGTEDEKKPGKEDTKITNVGINVFDDELEIDADPLAKTSITPSVGDAVAIGGGSGSGSGLLDLTRESDDTSLGAELLDVISPTESEDTVTQTEEPAEAAETMTAPEAVATDEYAMDAGAPVLAPVRTGPVDPSAPLFTGMMVASIIVLSLVGLVCASVLQGVWPDFLSYISLGTNLYMYVLGGGVGVTLIAVLIGFLSGRSGAAPRPQRRVVAR